MQKDKLVSGQRRKTLKSIITGAGAGSVVVIPSLWKKPVVQSVILPAHAQATGGGPGVGNGFMVAGLVDNSKPGSPLDKLIPAAYAGENAQFDPIVDGFLCIEIVPETMDSQFSATYQTGDVLFGGSGMINGPCTPLSACNADVADVAGIIVTAANDNGSFDFQLFPPGSMCFAVSPALDTTTTIVCEVEPCGEGG